MTVQAPPVPDEFPKQPWETFIISADISHRLVTGEYIVLETSDIIAEDTDGEDASADIIDNTDKAVETAAAADIKATPVTNGMLVTRVLGGTEALSKYKITFKAITSLDNQYETDVMMRIKSV
jgi:hypothetical protein